MIVQCGYEFPSTPQGTRKGEIASVNKDFNRTYSKKKVGDYSYYLNDLIGSGFSSQVFKCYHKQYRDKILAIKVIKMSKITKANYHLLQNEITILKGLDHPNIIRFHEVHYTENNCYLITDFCEGGTLQDHIDRFQPIDWEDVIRQLIQGCKYLSEKLIIHRDIKPANVFLKNGKWKIGDFGFARYIQSKQTLVKEIYKVGSPLYMPPQTLNHSIYSLKTDSFALGVLFYYIITKQYPWPGSNKKQLLQLFQTKLFPLHKISHIPVNIQQSIKGLCRLNVNERLFITDLRKEQFPQTPKKHDQFCLNRLASLQTCSEGSSEGKEEQNQSISIIFKQINEFDIIQRIKLCKFMHYIDTNIESIQELQLLGLRIKRMLKMMLVIFGWTKQAAYQKYVQQFNCKKYEQFEKMIEVKQLCVELEKQIKNMKTMEENKKLRAIRVKFIQLLYILKLVLKKQMSTAKEYISRIILHPDFSKVFISQNQVEEIQKLLQIHF